MSLISGLSKPPAEVKNFMPLRLNGKCDAVSMTLPAYSTPGVTVAMKHAGVVASPISTTFAPLAAMPANIASRNISPDNLGSRPTPIVTSRAPVLTINQSANARPMALAVVASNVIPSPSTPSSATPRISLPFCNFFTRSPSAVVAIARTRRRDTVIRDPDADDTRRPAVVAFAVAVARNARASTAPTPLAFARITRAAFRRSRASCDGCAGRMSVVV
mmetsp:Transcript_8654/g.32227  ORF Transcript_8654/g.32227 Transcript_8654/m.32227 type:complete len:218 (+) Transcript_8654:1219-1872(+)